MTQTAPPSSIESAARNYFPGIQDLRGWAALSVLLYHVHILFRKEKYFGHEVLFGFFEFGHRGVDLFFVISGFLMAMLTQRRAGREVHAGAFLMARAKRVYLPYLPVMLALTSACVLWSNVCPAAYSVDIASVLANVLILPRENLDTFVPVVAWTLAHEVFFYLMTFCALLLGRRGPVLLAVWLGASLALALSGLQLSFPLSFLLSPYNLAFGLGWLVFLLHRRWQDAIPSRTLVAVGALAFLGFGLVEVSARSPFTTGPAMALTLGFFLASFLLVLGYVGRRQARLASVGNASYSIYLVHYPVLVVLCMAARRVLQDRVPLDLLFVLVGAAALACGGLYYLVVERPGLRLLGRKLAP